MSGYTISKSFILLDKATEKQDEAICYKISERVQKIECILNIAVEKNDLSICDKIIDATKDFPDEPRCIEFNGVKHCSSLKDLYSEDKWRCYRRIADKLNNLQYCEKIEDFNIKSGCIRDIAGNMRDISICNNIKLSIEEDECYLYVLKVSKDQSLYKKYCSLIRDDRLRGKCVDFIIK